MQGINIKGTNPISQGFLRATRRRAGKTTYLRSGMARTQLVLSGINLLLSGVSSILQSLTEP